MYISILTAHIYKICILYITIYKNIYKSKWLEQRKSDMKHLRDKQNAGARCPKSRFQSPVGHPGPALDAEKNNYGANQNNAASHSNNSNKHKQESCKCVTTFKYTYEELKYY